MRKLKIWFRATFLGYPYYRVLYKDGKKTTPLYYGEAKGLSEVYNGKLIIDYSLNNF